MADMLGGLEGEVNVPWHQLSLMFAGPQSINC